MGDIFLIVDFSYVMWDVSIKVKRVQNSVREAFKIKEWATTGIHQNTDMDKQNLDSYSSMRDQIGLSMSVGVLLWGQRQDV